MTMILLEQYGSKKHSLRSWLCTQNDMNAQSNYKSIPRLRPTPIRTQQKAIWIIWVMRSASNCQQLSQPSLFLIQIVSSLLSWGTVRGDLNNRAAMGLPLSVLSSVAFHFQAHIRRRQEKERLSPSAENISWTRMIYKHAILLQNIYKSSKCERNVNTLQRRL